MSGLTLELRDAQRSERISGVSAFVAEDGSGSFGLRPGHARFLTALAFGLARFRVESGPWEYLALPGGVLHLEGDRLRITTRRYLRDADYGRISTLLREHLLAEERDLRATRESLRRMEEALVRRLWRAGEEGG